MKRTRHVFVICLIGLLSLLQGRALFAQGDESNIRKVLADQITAWNQGDIDTFMKGYKNSPDTTFIGKTRQHGWQQVLERYKRGYPTKEAMGTLDFSDLEVRMLGSDHAVVTGRYHLARDASGGGDASGIFSLVWEKTAEGWKIILDHTS
ncbi:MAG TPA: nuclear transport factor 2 family protein [Pseudacidobacterium sp.]|nr:nuclear transport factor 2 family protein [Pseudacidobacterium sp.]